MVSSEVIVLLLYLFNLSVNYLFIDTVFPHVSISFRSLDSFFF